MTKSASGGRVYTRVASRNVYFIIFVPTDDDDVCRYYNMRIMYMTCIIKTILICITTAETGSVIL